MGKAVETIHALTEMLGPALATNARLEALTKEQSDRLDANSAEIARLRLELKSAEEAFDRERKDLNNFLQERNHAWSKLSVAEGHLAEALDLLRAIGQNNGLSPRLKEELLEMLKLRGIVLQD